MNLEEPWPEEAAPDWAPIRALCDVVSGNGRLVWGEGNPDAPTAIILDNPGAREDASGTPYVCGTRRTLRRVLAEAGFFPPGVYVTFLFKCRPIAKYDRSEAKERNLPMLARQIREGRFVRLVALGNTVASALFGEENDVKQLRGAWHEWNGRPVRVGYHPLAARRRPNLYATLVDDFRAVAAAVSAGGRPANGAASVDGTSGPNATDRLNASDRSPADGR